jgi:PKD repeat protein
MGSGYDIGAYEQPPAPVAPVAGFEQSDNLWVGLTSLFTNATVAAGSAGSTSCVWSFGDVATDASVNPTHLYKALGGYIVVLTVTDYGGTNVVTVIPDA